MRHLGILTTILLMVTAGAASAQSERDAVLKTVDRFLLSLSSRDSALVSEVLAPEGRFFSITDQGDSTIFRNSTFADYLAGQRRETRNLKERIWDAEVLIHGGVAVVWAKYDFHINGSFSHCGVDAFTLGKGNTGWIITGVTYTVEATGCVASPLGPPLSDSEPLMRRPSSSE